MIADELLESRGGPKGRRVWKPVSMLGDGRTLAALSLALQASKSRRDRRAGRAVARALMAVGVVVPLLKRITGRMRPSKEGEDDLLAHPFRGKSFPSGHTAAAFAAATVLSRKDPKHKALYYTLASLVGISRVCQKRHYPSDVIAGAFIGVWIGKAALNGK